MTKIISFTLLVLFCARSVAQDGIPKSSWVASPVKVDGNPREWKLPLKYYDAETKLFFAFANDDKNLYLCLQAPDEMNQAKIMRAGMEIYLSIKGKHKVSVTFPLKSQAVPQPSQTGNNQDYDRKGRRTSFILQNNMMEVKGFETKSGLIPINDSSGINAAINWDESNKLTYEIAVPLKEWFGINYTQADMLKDIALDIEINAIKRQSHQGGGDEEDGFSGRGGGRMGGGRGMHHEGNANSEDDNASLPGENRMSMFEKSELKEKFILAQASDAK